MIVNARLPEFENNKFYGREFLSVGIRAIRINNKAGCVLSATHVVSDVEGVSTNHELLVRYNIVELPKKYRMILEKHSKQRKLIDGDMIYAGGIAFILNGMKQYFKYVDATVELDIWDCVGEHKEMLVPRTLVYYLTYRQSNEYRRGTVGSCEAITSQKRLMSLADVFEAEKIEKAIV